MPSTTPSRNQTQKCNKQTPTAKPDTSPIDIPVVEDGREFIFLARCLEAMLKTSSGQASSEVDAIRRGRKNPGERAYYIDLLGDASYREEGFG